MSIGSGQPESESGRTLRWSNRVLAAEDVRRRLNGHRTLIVAERTIVTPLAAEELQSNGVQLLRHEATSPSPAKVRPLWGFTTERSFPLVNSAVRALRRDGVDLEEFPPPGGKPVWEWALNAAGHVAGGACEGVAMFCEDPGLVCCVANKLAGLRAAAVSTVLQAARAVLTLGPNFVAVEMPGRTFFEVRQILRTFAAGASPERPAGLTHTLREAETHARG